MRRPVPQRSATAALTRPYVRSGESGWWRLRDNRLLIVCTANQIRSPMAAALLGQALEHQRVEAEIRSCGIAVSRPEPMAPSAAAAIARRGIQAEHVSRPLEARLVAGADLVLTMTRAHLREVVAGEPDAFARTFTFKECTRRARAAGPRQLAEPLGVWLERIAEGRSPTALLGDDEEDDIDDPVGQGAAAFERCAAELETLVRALVPLAWPVATVAFDGTHPVSVERLDPAAPAPVLPPLRAVVPPVVEPAPPAEERSALPPPIAVEPPPAVAPAAPAPAAGTPLPPPTPAPTPEAMPAPAPATAAVAPDGFDIDQAVLARMVRELVVSGDAFDTTAGGPMAAGEPPRDTDWPAPRYERWAASRLGGATVWLRGRSPQLVAQWSHAVANAVLATGRGAFALTGVTTPAGVPTVGAALLLAEAGVVVVTTGGRASLEEASAAHAEAHLPFVVVHLDDEPDPVRAVLDALGLALRP